MRALSAQDKRWVKWTVIMIAAYIAIFVGVIVFIGVEKFEGLPAVFLGLMNYCVFSAIAGACHVATHRGV